MPISTFRILRLTGAAAIALVLSGCELFYQYDNSRKATTPLVQFLYGRDEVPVATGPVDLKLPVRVGLSFLPAAYTGSAALPTAEERERVMQAIREKFRDRPYVTEIVIIPDYYLDGRRGNGFEQMQQLARMYQLDLYALGSYDIVTTSSMNKASVAYLTIIGDFFVHGHDQETHTLVDLAVVEPQSRQLVMRAGGRSTVKGSSAAIDLEKHEYQQVRSSFTQAGNALLDNFARELTEFEGRVREGTAPVRVVKRERAGSGAGALDYGLLAFLLCLNGLWVFVWKRRQGAARASG